MKTLTPQEQADATKEMFTNIANYGGGPAYPMQMQWGMTDGVPNIWFSVGLTKRDWFAGMALQGYLASFGSDDPISDDMMPKIAARMFRMADAMISKTSSSNEQTS